MTYVMPEELKMKVEAMTTLQRSYCEYRAKGLTQSVAAAKAGSTASDTAAKSRVGYQIEQMDGTKDYILWLQQQRAQTAVIDDIEVINMIRRVYDAAMLDDKYRDANKAVELLGEAIGLLGKGAASKSTQQVPPTAADAFTEDNDETHTTDRVNQLHQMLKDLKKSN